MAFGEAGFHASIAKVRLRGFKLHRYPMLGQTKLGKVVGSAAVKVRYILPRLNGRSRHNCAI